MRMTGRGSGRTTAQMLAAPKGATFVWCAFDIAYPKKLASKLGRGDLAIRPITWVKLENMAGLQYFPVVVDHEAELTKDQIDLITMHLSRKWR